MRVRGTGVTFGLMLAVVLALVGAVPSAQASPTSGPTTAVSIGDSYISGEAGRWAGNSISPLPGNDGTDRACAGTLVCTVDRSRVYLGGTGANGGCHRSDVAEILSARLAVDQRDNIACSGGGTHNVFRAASGGTGQNGEAPQADQLLPIARAKHVKLIVVSIGGNDLGFASIVSACLQAYATQTGPCQPAQQKKIDAGKAKAEADVGRALDEIRAVMTQAGYAQSDYRLILQTYPSVAPRGSELRYSGVARTANGCPFYTSDATWARDSAAGQIGAVAKAAADARGVETLDLVDAFQGHEFCSRSDRQSTLGNHPPASQAEWGRFVGASTIQQGDLQEAFHPNAYGQQAIGTCLTKAYAAQPGTFTCTGAAGLDPSQLSVRRLGGLGPDSTAGGGSTCLAPRVALGARRIGRLALGVRRTALLHSRALAKVGHTTTGRGRARYCVRGTRRGVVALFGRRTAVELLATAAPGYGNRGVRPGARSRVLARRYPHRRALGHGLYRLTPHGHAVAGVRRGRVRFVGLASTRLLHNRAGLRAAVRTAGP